LKWVEGSTKPRGT